MFRKKRGQITLFMIIGIVLLFSTSLIFYVKEKVVTSDLDITLGAVERTPLELMPIKEYVQECIKTVTISTLDRIGKNGGYLNPEEMFTPEPVYEKTSESIFLNPQMIPFWYYYDDNAGAPAGHRPPLCANAGSCAVSGPDSIEEQTANNIAKNLAGCLRDYGVLKESFDITPLANPIVVVRATEEDVSVLVDYPLEVVSLADDSKTRIKKFLVHVDIPLKQMYDFATDLVNLESSKSSFETMILQFIAIFSGPDKDMPPTYFTSLGISAKVWVVPTIKNIFDQDILDLMKLVQIAGTRSYKPFYVDPDTPNYEMARGLYSILNSIWLNKSYPFKVRFDHPQGNIHLSINGGKTILTPADAEATESNLITDLMSFVVNSGKFYYDISFPLIVKMDDPEALNGRGYSFNFGMEPCIKENEACSSSLQLKGVGQRISLDLGSVFHRVNKTITVKVKDVEANGPLSDARITYYCGEKYNIGRTNANGILIGKFPYCAVGGYMMAQVDGYFYSPSPFNNDAQDLSDEEVMVEMIKLKEIPIVLKKIHSDNLTLIKEGTGMTVNQILQKKRDSSIEVGASDLALLTIERVKDHPLESKVPMLGFFNFAQSTTAVGAGNIDIDAALKTLEDNKAEFTPAEYEQAKKELEDSKKIMEENADAFAEDSSLPTSTQYNITIVPGDYVVEVTLMHQEPFTLEEYPIEEVDADDDECEFGACNQSNHDEDQCCYPPMDMEPGWPKGGVNLNFSITQSMIDSGRPLVIYTMEYPLPTNFDNMGQPDILNDSIENAMYLQPSMG